MPKEPLYFYRELPVEKQDPVSIRALRDGELSEDFFHKVSSFSRNYFLPEHDSAKQAEQGDSYIDYQTAEPSVLPSMANDIPRTNVWYIRPSTKEQPYATGYCAGIGFNAKADAPKVIDYLKSLTIHRPTQWFLLTALTQGCLKATRYTEMSNFYDSLDFSNKDCGQEHRRLMEPMKKENGYYIYSYGGQNGVIVIEMELSYGSKVMTPVSVTATAVQEGDHPDMISFTYYQLTPDPDNEQAVSVSAIRTETLIYALSSHNLFLLSQYPEFFGQLQGAGRGEHPFIQRMRNAGIPLVARESVREINESFREVVCETHHPIEQAYTAAFKAVLDIKDSLDIRKFFQAIIHASALKFLTDEITDFLNSGDGLINGMTKIPDETEEYRGFKKSFLGERSDWLKIQRFFHYLAIQIKRVTKTGLFWDDTELVNLPLREGSMQRKVLAFLARNDLVSKEFFPENDDSVVGKNEAYWGQVRRFVFTKIESILKEYAEAIEMIMVRYPQLVKSKRPCDAHLPAPLSSPLSPTLGGASVTS